VRLPTASDVLQTEAFIQTQTAEIAAIDVEYESLKHKLYMVEAKRNAMILELLKSKAYLARIRALPQEVLGLIFLFYTDDPSQSPWTLMQVTRIWRAAALSTSAIWRKITLTSPVWHKLGSPRTKNGRELCGTKEQLDRALRRAGNTGLDLLISPANPRGNSLRCYNRKALHQMIGLLASSRKCLQVHHLEIDGSCNDYLLPWFNEYNTLKFPQLRTLHVRATSVSEFMVNISSSAKRIVEAELTMPYININFGLEDLIKCSSLVRLTLDGRAIHGFPGGLGWLKRILDNAPFITTLELKRMKMYRDNSPTQILRFPNLKTLILSKGSKPWCFSAPALTSMTLTEGSCIPSGGPEVNHFPHLASLTIEITTQLWGRVETLRDMVIPPLHTLDVRLSAYKNVLADLMGRMPPLNPVVFRLRKTLVHTSTLTEIIGTLDRLEELELEEVPIKKYFFEFLGSPKVALDNVAPAFPNKVEMHCPLLARLQVRLKGGSQAQHRSLRAAAKKAVKVRACAGLTVESWVIQFPDSQKWTKLA